MRARPDIVLLVLDTQRVDRLSCYGNQLETSPHIDELAADSTLFRHAVSTAQWTVPSHASMFTGLYPSSHNMFHASSVLPASLTTLAERLRDNHYVTTAYCNNPLLGVVNNVYSNWDSVTGGQGSIVGIPPTIVVGIYGMNFRFMPELAWSWGYPFALAVIVLSAVLPLAWYGYHREYPEQIVLFDRYESQHGIEQKVDFVGELALVIVQRPHVFGDCPEARFELRLEPVLL